jgi:predicted short-subunit dehydrogenase-like oxidoreductase (DUF2520 family)
MRLFSLTFDIMKIVIIGSGNVATVLGKKLNEAGHQILQVYNRSLSGAQALGDILSVAATDQWQMLDAGADVYLVAVSDQAISSISPSAAFGNKAVVHTAGSVPMNVLERVSKRYGVFYPLQTLRKEIPVNTEIPILIDANEDNLKEMLLAMGRSISPAVLHATDEKRFTLHIAAVFLNNFTNHLYALAESFCGKEAVSFELLKPLIQETASRVLHSSPSLLRTGPAIRGDKETIEKHLRKLEADPELRAVYLHLTESIQRERAS